MIERQTVRPAPPVLVGARNRDRVDEIGASITAEIEDMRIESQWSTVCDRNLEEQL